MYKIIGTDGQPYGPVNAEQIWRWVAENRINAQTLVQTEGAPDWKPLGAIPELAPELKTVPPTMAPPSIYRRTRRPIKSRRAFVQYCWAARRS